MDRKITKGRVITLGCKINRFESLAIKEQMEKYGIEEAAESAPADLYIVNTCTVTSKTDSESRRLIRSLKKAAPKSIIAVTGCYAQLKADELNKMPEVDLVIDNIFKGNIVKHVLESLKSEEPGSKVLTSDISSEGKFLDLKLTDFKGRNRAFLKVQDGCDSFCSYCIVPYARGRSRSLPVTDVIDAVKRFVRAGFKEIVFSGIHIGMYGADLAPKTDILGLIKKVENETGLERLRISSIEPNEITDEVIDYFSISKILCNHLHIPLQSGDDSVLKAMNRRYTSGEFVALTEKIKGNVKDVVIGADVIGGFPGEDGENFSNTVDLIKRAKVDYLHVFPYSRREGTKADGMAGHVGEDVKRQRARILRELGEERRRDAYERSVGRAVKVLFEKSAKADTGMLHGITRNYLNAAVAVFDADMFNTEREIIVKRVVDYNGRPLIILD